MITENDLLEAIAECKGQRNPNANTCIKLAAYYTILDHMTGREPADIPEMNYSESYIYSSDTEFMKRIEGVDVNTVMRVMDELMETLRSVQPRLYNAVLQKFE